MKKLILLFICLTLECAGCASKRPMKESAERTGTREIESSVRPLQERETKTAPQESVTEKETIKESESETLAASIPQEPETPEMKEPEVQAPVPQEPAAPAPAPQEPEAPAPVPQEPEVPAPVPQEPEVPAPAPQEPAAPAPVPSSSGEFLKDWGMESLQLQNEKRAENGVAPLAWDEALYQLILVRGPEIRELFSHTRPNDEKCFTVITEEYKKANKVMIMGENIAYGQRSPEIVSNGWYKSEGHRNNMLNARFTGAAVVCYKYEGICYWVTMFVG